MTVVAANRTCPGHRTFAVFAVAVGLAGCGAFPGAERRADTPTRGYTVDYDGDTRDIVVLDGEEPSTWHLVDKAGRRCFFQRGDDVSPTSCDEVPGAAEILGADEAAATPSSPSAVPEAPAVGEPEPMDYEEPRPRRAVEPVVPPPTTSSPSPAEPAPSPPEAPAPHEPPPAPRPEAEPADDGAPSADERRRFTMAYVAIYCDRRRGGGSDAAAEIEAVGLTVARYNRIEAHIAGDRGAWRTLVSAARNSCP